MPRPGVIAISSGYDHRAEADLARLDAVVGLGDVGERIRLRHHLHLAAGHVVERLVEVVRDLLDWPFGSMLSLALMAIVGAIFALGAMIAGADRITGAEGRE